MIINASVQVIPLGQDKKSSYTLIDEIIALIQSSKFKYRISAFETTIEGEFENVRTLLRKIEDHCYVKDNSEFLIYTKLHLSGSKNIFFEDKNLDR